LSQQESSQDIDSRESQEEIDRRNARFWDELCGSGLAAHHGITGRTPETVERFDSTYLGYYPYLPPFVLDKDLEGKDVLEIGLGYGTLGQLLASRGCRYHGLDIASGPVEMMRYRLENLLGADEAAARQSVRVGSALEIPHADDSLDFVYSIGCLHHTGNTPKAIAEVYRVLRKDGQAILMLYNKHSFRQVCAVPWLRFRSLFARDGRSLRERVRAMYDTNSEGDAAPCTEYFSRGDVRRMCRQFRQVRIQSQNFDEYVLFNGKVHVKRKRLLRNVARVLGLDLYITATK